MAEIAKEPYEDMVEREGGYYLAGFTSGYDPGDVYYEPRCGHCFGALKDLGDAQYEHEHEAQGRECWEDRQKALHAEPQAALL